MIEMDHVTKLYKKVVGVNDIELNLKPGAYGLLGPNGSGKTTFLNLMTGQLQPTLGTVKTLAMNPWNNPELGPRIGFCPSVNMRHRNVTGLEWVQYLLQLQGISSGKAREKTCKAMEDVGMADSMHRKIGEYSRGMQQRTNLAQAFAHDPELLILDEPFNGLDPIARHDITEKLKGWIVKGKSLILASHVLHEIEAVTRSFLLICNGRILAAGAAEEVRSLLADIPHEIFIDCDRPDELAKILWHNTVVDSSQITREKSLKITTRDPKKFYRQMPTWVREHNFIVSKIQSPDESLQSLFDSLLSIHRGEIL